MNKNHRYHILMTVCIAALLAAVLAALCLGAFPITPSQVFGELFGQLSDQKTVHTVIFNIRLPRVAMSIIAGAGLAAAGAAFQSLFANPLASPDTLGTANGAGFGAVLGILLGFSTLGLQLTGLLFGILAVLLVFLVTGGMKERMRGSMVTLILAGLVISSLFSALISLVKYTADPQDVLPVITFWLMGRFSSVTTSQLLTAAPFILAGILIIFLFRNRLNAVSLSEEEARSLGVHIKPARMILILASSMITASVVSTCGVIGWVGLLIPHIARMLLGNDNRRVVPASIVMGGLFLLIMDTIARCATASEIPVSILTAILGAPMFILILRKTGGIHS